MELEMCSPCESVQSLVVCQLSLLTLQRGGEFHVRVWR